MPPAKSKPEKTIVKPKRTAKTIYSRDEVAAIFERFKAANPEPKGELEHVNAFT